MDYSVEHTIPEVLWKNNCTFVPAYVIDFQVFAHNIFGYISSSIDTEIFSTKLDNIIRALWAIKVNRGPDMLPQMEFTAIVVDDYKGQVDSGASESAEGYWRHIVAQECGLQEYKIGRAAKPELFHRVKAIGYDYLRSKNSPFYYFKQVYMEADDLAGKLARIKRNSPPQDVAANRQLLLGTVDGDWQGLVSDEHDILWANTGPWLPRLRDEKAVVDYYLRKNKVKISSARECYDVKSIVGDAGDGLKPGSPLRLFDLWNEDHVYNFSEEVSDGLCEALNDSRPNTRLDHLESASNYLLSLGIIAPVARQIEDCDIKYFLSKAKTEREKATKLQAKGRFKKKCIEIEELDTVSYEDCVELSIQDWNTMKTIQENKAELEKCDRFDTECIRFFRNLISNLEDIRKNLKKSVDLLTKHVKRG